uniref:Fibronectin type-III domain-containing protein n=1 Tax=candidate division WOR-3 bacterium TaxID=2052148 RepID=A0A7V3ZY44_UNCW3
MRKVLYALPIAVILLLVSCIQPVGDITPSNLEVQAYGDGTQVKLTWEAPVDEIDGYILYFGNTVVDTIAPTINSYIHNPNGYVDVYKLYGYKGDTLSDPVTASIVPVTSTNVTVYEFNNPAGPSGFGFNDQFQCVSYSVSGTNPQENIDFYYTDWAPGYTGGDLYLASADQIADDPGRVTAPTTGWRVNKILKASPSSGIVQEPTLERDFAIDNAVYCFKVTRSDGWHYGTLKLGGVSNTQTTIVEVKIQKIPGLKVIGR